MHLDHKKLTELLAEASGLAESTIEKNLKELVDEIQQAIADGDAYELEGFGIFSGIGNNIVFIPSDELSTEINYKYVGMEAIEMDAPASPASEDNPEEEESTDEVLEDDPLAEIMGGAAEPDEESDIEMEEESEPEHEFESDNSDDYEDPFADIFNEVENDNDDDEISESSAVDDELELQETEPESSLDEEEEIILDEIISSEEKEEAELEETQPGPEKWGIDSYRDDEDENRFSGLLGSEVYDEKDKNEEAEEEDIFSEDDSEENKLSIMLDEDEAESETQDESRETEEDFDDPFNDFETESEEEGVSFEEAADSAEAASENDDIIPVIKNVSSGSGDKENIDNTGIRTRTRSAREKQNSPILLWILLTIILLGGATYGLGYFGIVDIPGIKGKNASSQTQTAATSSMPETNEEPSAPSEVQQPTPSQNPPQQEETDAEIPAEDENAASEKEPEEAVTDIADPEQPLYGMMGTPMAAANTGYTIVIYSLSNQESAENEVQQLLNDGYRAMVFPIPHAQYGTLYRVSLGQFETLRDAALASEDLIEPYSNSYFITKIQPTN